MVIKKIIRENWLILILVFTALIVRLIGIGQHSFWFDEGLEIRRTFTTWPEVLFSPEGPDPPGYRLLLTPLTHLAINETLIRLPSAIFGAISVYLIYWWIRLLGQPKLGFVAAGLLTISPIAIYYSQEASQYSLVIFFSLLLLIAFERSVQNGSIRNWLFLGLTGLASIFTFYGLLLLFPVLDIRLLWKTWKERTKERTIGFFAVHLTWLLGLLFLYKYYIQVQYSYMQEIVQPTSFSDMTWVNIILRFFNEVFNLVIRFQITIFSDAIPAFLPSLFIVGIIAGMFMVWKLIPNGRHVIWSSIALLFIQYIAAGFGFYIFGHRYSLILLPYLIFFLASLIWGIYQYTRLGGYLTGGLVIAIFLWFSPSMRLLPNPWMELPREELRPALQYMHEKKQANDFVYVYYGSGPAFQAYERDADYDYVIGPWFRDLAIEEKVYDIENAAQDYEQFWLVMSHIHLQENVELRDALSNPPYDYQISEEYFGDNAHVILFRKSQ
jgi:4-amino-4-deoxy-L-arabinose transferase-like glycosyltransferase